MMARAAPSPRFLTKACRRLGSGADRHERGERRYYEASASLTRKCTAAASLQGEKLKQKAAEIKSGIDGAESLIWKMDLEARNLQPSIRAGLLAKIREYKLDLNNLMGALKSISNGNTQQSAREELLESGMADTLGEKRMLLLEKTMLLFEISSIDDDDLQEKTMLLLELCQGASGLVGGTGFLTRFTKHGMLMLAALCFSLKFHDALKSPTGDEA